VANLHARPVQNRRVADLSKGKILDLKQSVPKLI
jgi:hypothetical protein